MKKNRFFAVIVAVLFVLALGLVGCDGGKTPSDSVVTVTAKQATIELQTDEVSGYDFTKLFTVTKDGASVTVTASMIDSSAVKAEAGTYTVKCTYESKSASVSVTVLAKQGGDGPSASIITVTAKQATIELQADEVSGYDFTKLFTVTKDGASVTVTASMIDSSAVKAEAGTYTVKCTYEGKSASVSVTVLAKQGGDDPKPGTDWGDWADVHNAKATIKPHAEGTVTYRFQAECTDLRGKSGYGSSGTAEGSGMAMPIGKTNDGCVNYLFGEGITINFFVVSDRDVDDAELSLCLGAEGMIVPVSPETFTIRVDRKIDDEELYDAFDADHDGARGDWDNSFLNYHTLSSETDRVIINDFDACPEGAQIDGRAYLGTDPKAFQLFKITSFLSLKKGVNCVSIVIEGLAFPPDENYGTKQCVAPVVDYMDIRTNAQLGFFGQMDNGGFGTDGLSIVG